MELIGLPNTSLFFRLRNYSDKSVQIKAVVQHFTKSIVFLYEETRN